ncbi:MAG: DJ-1/PfpI family protein [Chitinophagaceae bacterium]
MNRKILIVTGDGGESYEALYACHRFLEEGDLPVVAAPAKRPLHLVIHDFEPGWDTYIERTGYSMESLISFEHIVVDEYEAILLLGGRAPEYLRHNNLLLNIVRKFNDQGKWLFAICHGIQILVTAGLAKDMCMTAYEHVRSEIEMGGGKYSTKQAIRDKNIVTGQTWQSHPEFYREVFVCLEESK